MHVHLINIIDTDAGTYTHAHVHIIDTDACTHMHAHIHIVDTYG